MYKRRGQIHHDTVPTLFALSSLTSLALSVDGRVFDEEIAAAMAACPPEEAGPVLQRLSLIQTRTCTHTWQSAEDVVRWAVRLPALQDLTVTGKLMHDLRKGAGTLLQERQGPDAADPGLAGTLSALVVEKRARPST